MKRINEKLLCSDKINQADMGILSSFSNSLPACEQYISLLGFCDVHVHFREPGFSYKGTVAAGSKASARGGYTAVFTMPNLNPVPDTLENINKEIAIIERDAVIDVYPYAAITKCQLGEELSDMEDMASSAIAFSDDGKGVQSSEMMEEAMIRAKKLGKIIVAHCEDNSLLKGGYIHDGEYAKSHGHKGICSESEWGPIARDIELVRKTGCSYHVCHISTKESVDIIRRAKAEGLDVTCETAPHYLILDDSCLEEDGRFKMNPPLRSKEDREALVQGILDGTIDMIATDHAPHSKEDKSKGLSGSAFGVVGIETAFPAMYTYFVKTGLLTLERLEELLAIAPRERFGLPLSEAGFSVWKIDEKFVVNPDEFLSLGRATPFEKMELYGKNVLTYHRGKAVYSVI